MLAGIVDQLVAVSADTSRVFKVTLLNSPKVNAFALPGGYSYVTRGLLALANDSSEVAAVIAHEMAHVTADHALVRQEKEKAGEVGTRVVSGVLGGSTAGKVALAANKMRLSAFSQNQELQADAIGIKLIGQAGFDPFAAMRFLETMEKYSTLKLSEEFKRGVETFSSSHPSTPRRVMLARNHARTFGAPGIGKRGRQTYLSGIDGMAFGDSAEEGFVRGQTFSHKALGITFNAPKGFRIDNQSKAVLVSGPGDLATRFDATVLHSSTTLVDHLKGNWIKGLVEETIREETVNGLKAATASAAGDGWRFKVWLVRNGSQVFRFITAAPQTNTNLDPVARQIVTSFRLLNDNERAQLRPLRVQILPVTAGQSLDQYALKMKGVKNRLEMFKLLNGLHSGRAISELEHVKVITD